VFLYAFNGTHMTTGVLKGPPCIRSTIVFYSGNGLPFRSSSKLGLSILFFKQKLSWIHRSVCLLHGQESLIELRKFHHRTGQLFPH